MTRQCRKRWGASHSDSGAGDRATGTVKALTERAPTAMEVRTTLESMMIEDAERKNR